jgi:stage IV sporulation protein FB
VRIGGVKFQINPFLIAVLIVIWFVGLLPLGFLFTVSVLLHELVHVWMAKRSGLTVDAVELLPFGGVVRLVETLGVDPMLEACVSIVGPLFSIGLGILAALAYCLRLPYSFELMHINLVLGLLNLLPALPLDGGRLLRASLVMNKGYRRGTGLSIKISGVVGWLSIVSGTALLFYNISSVLLICLGVFILLSLQEERKQSSYVFMGYLLARRLRLLAQNRSSTRHLAFVLDTTIKEVVSNLNYKDYHIIWVLDRQCRVIGFLGESELLEAAFMQGSKTEIGTLISKGRWPVPEEQAKGFTPTSKTGQ